MIIFKNFNGADRVSDEQELSKYLLLRFTPSSSSKVQLTIHRFQNQPAFDWQIIQTTRNQEQEDGEGGSKP